MHERAFVHQRADERVFGPPSVLRSWVEQAAHTLLAAPAVGPPVDLPPPPPVGVANDPSEREEFLHALLEALVFHKPRGHAPLAQPLHELWRAAAASRLPNEQVSTDSW